MSNLTHSLQAVGFIHVNFHCAAVCSLLAATLSFSQVTRDGEGKRRMRNRDDNAPKAGEVAPAFKLKSLNGIEEMDLESYRGVKPVILLFGSYS